MTRLLLAGTLFLILALGPAHYPTQKNAPTASHTFKSPDGSFQFTYPTSFTLYTGSDAAKAGRSLSYNPICDVSIACVVYPATTYAGTNFDAASFQLLDIRDATSSKACLTPPFSSPNVADYVLDSRRPTRVINRVVFIHGTSGDAGLSHYLDADLYRAFHNGTCYELSVNIAQTSYAAYDEGTVKQFLDWQHVHDALMKIVDSFEFLK